MWRRSIAPGVKSAFPTVMSIKLVADELLEHAKQIWVRLSSKRAIEGEMCTRALSIFVSIAKNRAQEKGYRQIRRYEKDMSQGSYIFLQIGIHI